MNYIPNPAVGGFQAGLASTSDYTQGIRNAVIQDMVNNNQMKQLQEQHRQRLERAILGIEPGIDEAYKSGRINLPFLRTAAQTLENNIYWNSPSEWGWRTPYESKKGDGSETPPPGAVPTTLKSLYEEAMSVGAAKAKGHKGAEEASKVEVK